MKKIVALLVFFLTSSVVYASSETKWYDKLNLRPDARLRYQLDKKDGSIDRNRFRYRLRIASNVDLYDDISLGLRFAGGSPDPRSTNQTMGSSFERAALWVDRVFIKYTPVKSVNTYLGKMPLSGAFWTVSEVMWDNDINPEGVALGLNTDLNDNFNIGVNSGFYVLRESSRSASCPYVIAFQPLLNWKISDNLRLKTATSFFIANNVKGKEQLGWSSRTNSVETIGTGDDARSYYLSDYNVFNPILELAVSNLSLGPVGRFSVFGEYLYNYSLKNDNDGFLVGLKIGSNRLSEKNDWQILYSYRKTKKDAVLDMLPDSDFYGGSTGVQGNTVKVTYMMRKNLNLGFAYHRGFNIATSPIKHQVFQFDIGAKI